MAKKREQNKFFILSFQATNDFVCLDLDRAWSPKFKCIQTKVKEIPVVGWAHVEIKDPADKMVFADIMPVVLRDGELDFQERSQYPGVNSHPIVAKKDLEATLKGFAKEDKEARAKARDKLAAIEKEYVFAEE